MRLIAILVLGAMLLERAASAAPTHSDGDLAAWIDRLAGNDPAATASAVTAIEASTATDPELADALFQAARACEDTLADPARALALYERILRDFPDARAAFAAKRRAQALRPRIGPHGEHAARARELAALIASADRVDAPDVIARGELLATADWPGAGDAALWLADWRRRTGELDDALARYDRIIAQSPTGPLTARALRAAASTALEARQWDRAERYAHALPVDDGGDPVAIERDDLIELAARGRWRSRGFAAAWIAIALAVVGLLASAAAAMRRGVFAIWSLLRPPAEVWFLAPIAAVLIVVAIATQPLIASAVARVALGGLALAWLSGSGLEAARGSRGFALRVVAHGGLVAIGVIGLLYTAIYSSDLFDLFIESFTDHH